MIAYETTFICRPDMNETNHKTLMDKIKGIISAHEGEVIAVEDWGRRRLAYPIKKETRGYYTYLVYSGNNSAVAEIERNLRINEQVIRFLTVKVDEAYDAKTFKRKPTPNVATQVAAQAAVQAAVQAE